MLRSRIIPCLLVHSKGLVKTQKFSSPKYVGDPINAVRIFNEKEVDELMVLDIDATREGRSPDLKMIASLADECRMPLCYGGGIQTADQAQEIISLGVEKVALSTAAIKKPILVTEIAERIGTQSVSVVLDFKKNLFGNYTVFYSNATLSARKTPEALAQEMESRGAGEIVLNSVDRDGQMCGYDIALAKRVRESTNLPLTVLGGAGGLEHIRELVESLGTVGAGAGSLFVFKGKYRAVLISYPTVQDKRIALGK